MTKLRHFQGAIPFFIAVFLNAFVDLGHKITIQNTVYKLYDGPEQVILTAIVNALILLPFIVLMSPAGFLSDKFSKTHIMRLSAWAAVGFTVLITVFYYLGWFWLAFAMTFLLAAQSAIYSPAKMGYIKELFGKARLGEANGVVASLSIIAILAGIFAYSILFENFYQASKPLETESEVIRAIAPIGFILIINSIIELILTYRLPTPVVTPTEETFSTKQFLTGRLFKKDLQPVLTHRAIGLSIVGLSVFWAIGQVMLAAFPAFFKQLTENDNTILVQGILACSGLGIAVGSTVAGKLSKNHIEIGLVPIGAAGIALGLVLLTFLDTSLEFALDFFLIGFSGGLFIVPLNALIQFNAQANQLGKILAANNWVQNIFMFSFLVLSVTFAYFGWNSATLLQLIAVIALIGCVYVVYEWPQSLTRFLLSFVLSRRYKVKVQGLNNFPAKGGVLLLGNHISWIDWAIVQIACPRRIRFVMDRGIYEKWFLKWFFDMFGCIPIDQGPRSRRALETVTELLNQGEAVCLFPEGSISRTGHMAEFRKGFEHACEKVNDKVVILPFYMRGLWGSQFSRSSSRLKSATSSILTRDIIFAFGEPMSKDSTADVVKRQVFDLSIHSWQAYVEELPTINRLWIESAKKTGRKDAIIDNTMDVIISGNRALTSSVILSRRIKKLSPAQNVGVLLPTSAAGALVNMGILMAGKTIVNLNYTASPESIAAAIEQAEISTVFTSKKFLAKLKTRGVELDLSGVDVVEMEAVGESISNFEKISTLIAVKLIPSAILRSVISGFKQKSTDVAAILFSSGSEGAPKGVKLTHKNILANVKQIADVLNMEDDDAIMANLPLFHAFGLTVTQFLPLLEGCPMICHADPTDALGCAKAVAKYNATIMCGTSTFLRLYCRNSKVVPLMLDSLRIVVAGAEKLSTDVREAFGQKFNKIIYEGYGATETTPVTSVNVPDQLDISNFSLQRGSKVGSVGMPLPGTSCMIVDPDTFEELPTGQAGMILIGGAQVMKGYLKQPEKTESVIKELKNARWYVSGDKGYLDADGFLYVVDRYSRFAKLGGEMVSLGAVESAIAKIISDPEKEAVITSLPDDKKGEKLVVLYDQELDVDTIKQGLMSSNLNSLSIPQTWLKVETLPKLGSGKTDFVKAKRLAEEMLAD
ncbi:acyl-[ACP]--phospholipid O-acyltransferase [Sessilibacter sp. MAH4]